VTAPTARPAAKLVPAKALWRAARTVPTIDRLQGDQAPASPTRSPVSASAAVST
jgi:hypothetical protein